MHVTFTGGAGPDVDVALVVAGQDPAAVVGNGGYIDVPARQVNGAQQPGFRQRPDAQLPIGARRRRQVAAPRQHEIRGLGRSG